MVSLQNRSDWQTLSTSLNMIQTTVAGIPHSKWPKTDLGTSLRATEALLAEVERFSISRIGQLNAKRELLAVLGTLKTVQHQVEEEGRTVQSYKPELTATFRRVEAVFDAVQAKLTDQTYDANVGESVEAVDAKNLSESMREAIKQLTKEGANSENKTDNRDVVNIASVVEANKRDQTRMTAEIRNAFIPSDPENFTIVKGPIITNAPIDENRLSDGNVPYQIVYFPGVQYTFQRREAVPRMYILRDQILVAVKLSGARDRFQFNLKKNPPKSAIQNVDKRFAELREEILSSLSSKLHVDLVDVLEQRSRGTYIVSSAFPGVRFLWLVRSSVYRRIGPFSPGSQVGMPF